MTKYEKCSIKSNELINTFCNLSYHLCHMLTMTIFSHPLSNIAGTVFLIFWCNWPSCICIMVWLFFEQSYSPFLKTLAYVNAFKCSWLLQRHHHLFHCCFIFLQNRGVNWFSRNIAVEIQLCFIFNCWSSKNISKQHWLQTRKCLLICNPSLLQSWWQTTQIVVVINHVAKTKAPVKWLCVLKLYTLGCAISI